MNAIKVGDGPQLAFLYGIEGLHEHVVWDHPDLSTKDLDYVTLQCKKKPGSAQDADRTSKAERQ